MLIIQIVDTHDMYLLTIIMILPIAWQVPFPSLQVRVLQKSEWDWGVFQSQAGYEDNAFENCEINGDDVQIENFVDNNNGRAGGGAWVPPVKSTAFRGAKISGKAKIVTQSHNGNLR